MEIKEEITTVLRCFDDIGDIPRKKIKKNLLKPIDSIDLDLRIDVLRLKSKLKERGIFIKEDRLWFFMELWCVNGFKTGTEHVATAIETLNIAESKFKAILNSEDFEDNDEKIRLLRMVRFINSHEHCINLDELFTDIKFWKNQTKVRWIEKYTNIKGDKNNE